MFLMLRDDGVRKVNAARIAMIFAGSFRWSGLERASEGLFIFSATHKLEAIDLQDLAENLIAKADRLVNRLNDTHLHSADAAHDLAWLSGSKENLRVAFDANLARDPLRGKRAFLQLHKLGWDEQLISIRDRMVSALQTNFPPATKPLPLRVRKAMGAAPSKSDEPDEE